jgi:hypothetical protein
MLKGGAPHPETGFIFKCLRKFDDIGICPALTYYL